MCSLIVTCVERGSAGQEQLPTQLTGAKLSNTTSSCHKFYMSMLILRISNNLQYIYKTKDSYLKILNNNYAKE